MRTTVKMLGWMMAMWLLATAGVQAQKTIVKGVVLDSLTQEGEPFATIRIYKQGNHEQPVAMKRDRYGWRVRSGGERKGCF